MVFLALYWQAGSDDASALFKRAAVVTTRIVTTESLSPEDTFERFLRLDVAKGNASADTVRSYRLQVRQWSEWCAAQGISVTAATEDNLREYRRSLIEGNYAIATIGLKLTVLRRFYEALVRHGVRPDNPVRYVQPPDQTRAEGDIHHLSLNDLGRVLGAVRGRTDIDTLRNRALILLMGLHGLRGIEIERADVSDLRREDETMVLLVHGKRHDRMTYLRPDVARALEDYRAAAHLTSGALFRSVDPIHGGERLQRNGLRDMIDDAYTTAGVKRQGVSSHALRHTAGTLTYHYTRNLRAVQDMLGHADPKTTAKYAHLVDRAESNPALAVPLEA